MKAIERAAFWTQSLESVGFDIDCQTEERWGATYLTVNAQKDLTRLNYVIRMDTFVAHQLSALQQITVIRPIKCLVLFKVQFYLRITKLRKDKRHEP